MQLEDGSWKDGAYLPIRIDDEEVLRCPRRPVLEDPEYYLKLLMYFGMFKKGHLPDPGPVTAQADRTMNLFRIVDDISEDCRRLKEERERARSARQGRRG